MTNGPCNLLKARIRNVGEWKAVLNAIGDIVEDAMFIVNDDGITFRGMDPSHVALLDVTFLKSSFDVLESKTSFFGIRVDDFKTVMNTVSNDEVVEMIINDQGIMKISITGTLPSIVKYSSSTFCRLYSIPSTVNMSFTV